MDTELSDRLKKIEGTLQLISSHLAIIQPLIIDNEGLNDKLDKIIGLLEDKK